jgi:hypothetical protein
MAIAREAGMTAAEIRAANAAVNAARAGNDAPVRSTTTADERARESGSRYGSGNTAPAVGVGVGGPAAAPVAGATPLPVGGVPVVTTSAIDTSKDLILEQTLTSYGMNGIGAIIKKIRAENPEIGQDDLLFLLKNDQRYNGEYLARFAGNAILKSKGLPTMADSDYLKAEKEYEKIFKAYGVDSLANRSYYGQLIGNLMDADDVSSRVSMGYKVYKGNPNIKNAFNKFYGTVTDGDVVAAMLDPETQIPLLQKKITVAEIGGAALQQNLATSLVRAQELEAFGVTGAAAQVGYTNIAQGLVGYEKLLEMRTGQDVQTLEAQTMLENSKLVKQAKAMQEEQSVLSEEINRFGGTAGRFASKSRAQGLI